jgi:putative redox protein
MMKDLAPMSNARQQESHMNATVTLDHGMTFLGVPDSGFEVKLGSSPDVGGDDDGPRPMELMLLGLAGCTAMDVISILRKKRQDITSFSVHAHADRQDQHPKVFTEITLTYHIEGRNVDPKAVERAIELSETKYCPAQAMMAQVAKINLAYQIGESP